MNSPDIYFDADNHALLIRWHDRGPLWRLTATGQLDEVNSLPAGAIAVGNEDVWQEAFRCGYDESQEASYEAGYQDGVEAGFDDGYHQGYDFGFDAGREW